MRTSVQVKAEIKELRDQYEAVVAQNDPAHDDELRQMDQRLEALLAEYSDAATHEGRAASNREAMKQIFGQQAGPVPQPTDDGDRSPARRRVALDDNVVRLLSEQVMANPDFAAWHRNLTAGGRIPEGVPINSPVVQLDSQSLNIGATLVTGLSSTSGGALVINDRLGTIVPAVRDQLTIIDLVTHQTTTSDTVEYVRVGTETNNAAPVAEATSAADGAKPESAAALSVVTAIVETIAHWIPVTRRAMSDAGQLAGYLDDFLRDGLRRALNTQLISGNGTSPNLRGITNTSGIQSQAFTTGLLETTRKARTKVRTVGGAVPSAYAMDPLDWEAIDLLTDNEQRYYFGGPGRMGTPILWGLPVAEDMALTAGVAYVADWSMAVVWDREQARVLMTDSHSDYFIRNILVLLAELRAAFGILRPSAFVEIDLTP
jgi:HK97 family phage major capsid protein